MKKSITLSEKLNIILQPSPDHQDIESLIIGSYSQARFDSQRDFESYLSEGALLNISAIGSKALSVPCGEYLVWLTDAGHTVLFPTNQPRPKEVFEQNRDQYEVLTKDLMRNWNKLERVLAEDLQPQSNEYLKEPEENSGDPEEDRAGEFRSTIDASTVDRTPIMRAIQDRGYTVTSLAQAVGVDPPAISRIMRTPKDVQGDPGGRNPSMGLASKICSVLRIDPTAAFPDIFNAKKYNARQTPGNDASGSHSVNHTEDLKDTMEEIEASEAFDTLCESIRVPFPDFWKNGFWPSVRLLRPTSNILEFIDTMTAYAKGEIINEFFGRKSGVKQHRQNMTQQGEQWANDAQTQTQPKQGNIQAASDKMTQMIMPGIKEAFKNAMEKLKQNLQQIQMKAGANPKLAPHAWEIVNRFYKTVTQAGEAYQPKWKMKEPQQQPGYQDAYKKAKTEFQGMQTDPLEPEVQDAEFAVKPQQTGMVQYRR